MDLISFPVIFSDLPRRYALLEWWLCPHVPLHTRAEYENSLKHAFKEYSYEHGIEDKEEKPRTYTVMEPLLTTAWNRNHRYQNILKDSTRAIDIYWTITFLHCWQSLFLLFPCLVSSRQTDFLGVTLTCNIFL